MFYWIHIRVIIFLIFNAGKFMHAIYQTIYLLFMFRFTCLIICNKKLSYNIISTTWSSFILQINTKINNILCTSTTSNHRNRCKLCQWNQARLRTSCNQHLVGNQDWQSCSPANNSSPWQIDPGRLKLKFICFYRRIWKDLSKNSY